tara:strand:+ start:329 stop:436 length:108 start_codon:yes stop_codon:yes gene_type:complete
MDIEIINAIGWEILKIVTIITIGKMIITAIIARPR